MEIKLLPSEFKIEAVVPGISYDLIKDKKVIAYGISLKQIILYIAHYELNNNDITYNLKEYLNALKSKIKEYINA